MYKKTAVVWLIASILFFITAIIAFFFKENALWQGIIFAAVGTVCLCLSALWRKKSKTEDNDNK